MANLLLRPQVTAFVDVVTTASGDDLRFEEIEVTDGIRPGRQVDPRARHPQGDRRADRRAAQARRQLRHDADAGGGARRRRRPDRRGHRGRAARARGHLRATRDALPAERRCAPGGALSELADAPVELERPQDPSHGDYATNVALQSAPKHRRAPREFAAELAERAATLDEVERAEVAGPGFVNLWVTSRVARRSARGDRRRTTAAALPRSRRGSRSSSCPRIRPAR